MTESGTVAAFIRDRQDRVLDRAVTTVTTVDDAHLATESHRLAGTLGTFDLPEAAAVMRALEITASAPGVTSEAAATARAAALQSLAAIVASRPVGAA